MKLYYAPGACSLAPHIVASEAGVLLELEKVDLATHTLADGSNYYDVNPRGYVPAVRIKDGEPVLTEANVVVQFIADQKPESGLMPKAGTPERYRAQQRATGRPDRVAWTWTSYSTISPALKRAPRASGLSCRAPPWPGRRRSSGRRWSGRY